MITEEQHLANALTAFIGRPLDNPLSRSEMMETARIALSALTQSSSPALKLPDAKPDHDSEDGNDIDYLEPSQVYVLGVDDGFNRCLREVVKLNAPHTAHIEPSCNTGGAWVKCSEQMPKQHQSNRYVPLNLLLNERTVAQGGFDDGEFWIEGVVVNNVTRWMPLPAEPEEE